MFKRTLQRIVDVRDGEIRVLLWSCAYFFCVLTSYYVLRPLREQMGIARGTDELPWLFTGTMIGALLANSVYAAIVARFPRKTFIPIAYRFFAFNLVAFWVLMRTLPESQTVHLGYAFFMWLSVFNLFVVSVFWSFMADIFRL